jgi:hypothetical protein
MFQTEVVKTIKTHILFSVTLFFKNLAIDEIMWKDIVESDRSQMTVWSLCIACWIPKDTNITHTLGIRNTYCSSTATVVA